MKKDIFVVLAQRSWQGLSGLITIILVARFLSPELQGWYYSFLSVAAFYTLFDLGLSIVIVQLTAHLFVDLKWGKKGKAEGPSVSRFREFTFQIFKHYRLLAIAFILIAVPGGYYFFSLQPSAEGISWKFAWLGLALATAGSIMTIPALAIVEGSGRIKEVYSVRLSQGVAGSIACWIMLSIGGNLWAAVMPALTGVVTVILWLLFKRPRTLVTQQNKIDQGLRWKTEIWPLQWKIGLTWFSGYLLTAIYTPILFHYQGPIVAGQMGLSLTIANMLGILSQSWIARHVPQLAQFAAKKDWHSMDKLFRRDFSIATASLIFGAIVICCCYCLLAYTPYQHRVLPFVPFAGLLGIALLNHIIGGLAVQLRSYKQEPLVWVAALAAVATVPLAIWSSQIYSAEGVVASIFCVQLFFSLPAALVVWRHSNKKWRTAIDG